jgi:hypothetical protein
VGIVPRQVASVSAHLCRERAEVETAGGVRPIRLVGVLGVA